MKEMISSDPASCRTFVLEKTIKRERKVRHKSPENFVRRRISKADLASLKYEQFEPLYQLWLEYYSTLLEGHFKNPDERLLRADYHGCLLMVTEADNPSHIGIHGIVVRETRHTFQLITKKNKFSIIPKQGSTFQFIFNGHVFTIFGDAFRFKPTVRIKKVLRNRLPIPFFL
ncbi:hypothetical protein AB6A40_001960 [Gnathostoma spinigerum]|uniref:Ribonuclease P protein subunit p29 n=1 Tax=Gnathostoma spinigerum TaxID=75299 RepID=A0ABD6ED00_9BILA